MVCRAIGHPGFAQCTHRARPKHEDEKVHRAVQIDTEDTELVSVQIGMPRHAKTVFSFGHHTGHLETSDWISGLSYKTVVPSCSYDRWSEATPYRAKRAFCQVQRRVLPRQTGSVPNGPTEAQWRGPRWFGVSWQWHLEGGLAAQNVGHCTNDVCFKEVMEALETRSY